MSSIIEVLSATLEAGDLLTGDAIGPQYMTDWTGVGSVRPMAVILARSTEQVATVLRICNAAGQRVVPQGGMTGLAGGAVPTQDDFCLSMERMCGIGEIDRTGATMTVLAGTTLHVVQQAALQEGFEFPLDMGSRGSCQIGGVLATNAGGIRVIQSGAARENVLGLEAVLADGTVLTSMNKMIKNNTGYDLKHWFIGSEGTLGVITRAVLRLRPKPAGRHTALCALGNYQSVLDILHTLRSAFGNEIGAFEIMWSDFFDFGVEASRAKASPFPSRHPVYALVEQTSFNPEDRGGRFIDLLSHALHAGTILDAIVAHSAAEARALWEIRECTAEFPARLNPINFDISVPIGQMGRFADECKAELSSHWPAHTSLFFGHIGDSNLHVTVDRRSIPGVSEQEVESIVYSLVGRYSGSVSAEHGIGLLKRKYLHHSRTEAELRAMWAIKNALDPKGILNRGKVLPDRAT
jgi:FAD/FMN-containing dehydrogenase